MRSLTDGYLLGNGVKIPCIGFGTFRIPNGEIAVSAVKTALAAGYRHIDTAQGYGNEESVGIAARESGVSREELFITSKLANSDHGYDRTLASFERTMERLDMEYIDLFLIHWPNPVDFRDCWRQANAGTWKALEELYTAKRIRAIGVSNFHPRHIEPLLDNAAVLPMVNQIRLCPGDTQDEVVAYCRKRNILLEAYNPLGAGQIFHVPQMKELARKYEKSVAQISLRWSLQMGFLPLPKSVTPARIRENADVFGFELTPEDVSFIAGLRGCVGYSQNPDTADF